MKKKPRNRPVLQAEERKMADAMRAAWLALGVNQTEMAERIGVTQGMFAHWVNGRERVAEDKAPALASVLGLRPEDVSLAYREKASQFEGLRGDIMALRFAVTGLATAISATRPDEAEEIDSRIRDAAAGFPRFLEGGGWLGVLLGQMQGARRTSAAAPAGARVRKGAASSGRNR